MTDTNSVSPHHLSLVTEFEIEKHKKDGREE